MLDNEQVEEILLVLDDKLTKTVSVLKEEYASVRAGRANPHILDKVTVDYYGAPTPVTQTSNISVSLKGHRKGYSAVKHRHNAHQRRQGYPPRFPPAYRRA